MRVTSLSALEKMYSRTQHVLFEVIREARCCVVLEGAQVGLPKGQRGSEKQADVTTVEITSSVQRSVGQ